MKFIGVTPQGEYVTLPAPISVRMSAQEDAPADALTAVFPGKWEQTFCVLLVQDAAGKLIFDGIVDEQLAQYSASGCITQLEGRSRAALLLDNEAIPQTYAQASLAVLFERHAVPYGFHTLLGDVPAVRGAFAVKKGWSEWQALEGFCRSFFKAGVRALPGGILQVQESTAMESLCVTPENGFQCTELQEHYNDYGVYSQLWTKQQGQAEYDCALQGALAQERGIQRRRLFQEGTDLSARLKNSEKDAYQLTLFFSGFLHAELGTPAEVIQPNFERNGLYLAGWEYRLNAAGEQTKLTLKRQGGTK